MHYSALVYYNSYALKCSPTPKIILLLFLMPHQTVEHVEFISIKLILVGFNAKANTPRQLLVWMVWRMKGGGWALQVANYFLSLLSGWVVIVLDPLELRQLRRRREYTRTYIKDMLNVLCSAERGVMMMMMMVMMMVTFLKQGTWRSWYTIEVFSVLMFVSCCRVIC